MAVKEFEQPAENSHAFFAPGLRDADDRIAVTQHGTAYSFGNRTLVAMGKVVCCCPGLTIEQEGGSFVHMILITKMHMIWRIRLQMDDFDNRRATEDG